MSIKSIISIILLILIANVVHGQYTPFVEEGKFWIYKNHLSQELPSSISGHAITFSGDTIINSLTYKKVYKLHLKGEHDCPLNEQPCWSFDYPYQTEVKVLTSFIREDTLNKKIYTLPDSIGSQEQLLFDYSLKVGDTLNLKVYESIGASNTKFFPGGIVDSIKSVNTHGKLRNTIFTYGLYAIQGLPFETAILLSEGLGFREFGIYIIPKSIFVDYCEGEIEQCNLILSNESIQVQKKVNIFPNPSTGIFQVSINQDNLKSLRAYSIFGQLRKESKFSNKIDLSNLENGLYLLEITTRNDEKILKKIKLDH